MAIASSGAISFSDIQTEFGGTNPIGLGEYYANGGLVPASTSGTYGAVPSSGAISVQNFYGTTAVVPPDTIGQAYGGGYYAGKISTSGNGVATHYLIVAPVASGVASSQAWRTSVPSNNNFANSIDGPGNSETMNSGTFPAAQWCRGLNIGGYTDWYLPALYELEVCYYFLKPSTNGNSGGYGSNPYAVSPQPRNTNYTNPEPPSRTSVSAFQSGGAEAFTLDEYWTSTQEDSYNAKDIYFQNGIQYSVYKTTADAYHKTRAVRRIPV